MGGATLALPASWARSQNFLCSSFSSTTARPDWQLNGVGEWRMASRTMSWMHSSGTSTSSVTLCSEPRFTVASPMLSVDLDMVRWWVKNFWWGNRVEVCVRGSRCSCRANDVEDSTYNEKNGKDKSKLRFSASKVTSAQCAVQHPTSNIPSGFGARDTANQARNKPQALPRTSTYDYNISSVLSVAKWGWRHFHRGEFTRQPYCFRAAFALDK